MNFLDWCKIAKLFSWICDCFQFHFIVSTKVNFRSLSTAYVTMDRSHLIYFLLIYSLDYYKLLDRTEVLMFQANKKLSEEILLKNICWSFLAVHFRKLDSQLLISFSSPNNLQRHKEIINIIKSLLWNLKGKTLMQNN